MANSSSNWKLRQVDPEIPLQYGDEIPRCANMHRYYGQADDVPLRSGQGFSPPSLPPHAGPTLFVEGFPSDITRRELSHIFRPLRGYKGLRLIKKDSQLHRDVKTVLCFVDFSSPTHAAIAMSELQGYKVDQHDPDSPHLKLEFAHPPVVHQNH